MNEFLEILKYILPSTVVALTSYFIFKKFLDREYSKTLLEIRMNNQKMITPIKLQAYERLILLMERISLNSLIMRTHKHGMSAKLLQSELVKTIRNEYEHNLAQQIYVSSAVWDAIKNSKEETIKAINIAAIKMPDTASGIDLCNIIFELIQKVDRMPSDVALEIIKAEARQVMQ
jgi:hypothetical protein